MTIPKALIEYIQEGNIVLFLGAGASIGAKHEGIKPIPNGQQLAEMLVDKFLGKEYSGISLLKAAELSISQTDLFTVQDYIASIFIDYYPAAFHLILPTFFWKAIYTTNFDLVIQRAYDQAEDGLQKLAPFVQNTDRIDDKLKNPDSIPYTKLHGCITYTRDAQIPLILTTEQYISHRKERKFLFERYVQHAAQFPVIYIGSNLDDSDIRAILLELKEEIQITPRSYIVSPSLKQAEKSFWESYALTCIDMTFEAFLKEIDIAIPKTTRKLAKLEEKYEHPICQRFRTKDTAVPDTVKLLLSRDVEYLNKEIKPTELTPQQFYKGYYKDCSPIIYNYDIKRPISDNIISEVFLLEEEEKENPEELYILRGHAGSGKTVLLRRIAWDSAIEFNKLCLWLHSDLFPEYDALLDLFRLCGERIFIFIDPIHKHQEVVQLWLTRARRDKLPLTIIGAERNHEWNISCTDLLPYVKEIYDLKYLRNGEIEELIAKLGEHKSLGYLEGLPLDKQIEEFSQRAGRQLLVALYEATLGKSFQEIIFDEYKSISSLQAKSLYLTICVLHRLGVPTRAGLISRVHNITFPEFQDKFFKPLDFIVFVGKDKFIRDYVYLSRHPVVAEMVFEQVLLDEQDRFNEYIRLINAMDMGYSSDRESFMKLINGRQLMQLFRNTEFIRRLFENAKDRVGENPYLLQQEAIFEMNSADGSIEKAGGLLRKSITIQPSSKVIKHSLSEWALKKAEKAKTELEKTKYKRESKKIAKELTQGEIVTAHPFHTLIKIGLEELREVIEIGDPATIERKVGEVERIIVNAKQFFPEQSVILSEESKFCEYVNNHPKAKSLLEQAFSNNKGNPFIAIRLANLYEEEDPSKAIEVLSECVDAKPNDKNVNFNLAMMLQKYRPEKRADIKLHLRRSFTDGDSKYAAQFWYARFLYMEDPKGDAYKYFKNLGQAYLNPEVKNLIRGIIVENGNPVIFRGVVTKKEHSFSFINRDGYQDAIFVHIDDVKESIWEKLREGDRVYFEMGFSYRGPRAQNLKKE